MFLSHRLLFILCIAMLPFVIKAQSPSYRYNLPDSTWKLPTSLNEISGLSVDATDHIYAVQDERGCIFSTALSKGNHWDSIAFGSEGDFEGIETVGDEVWVLKSKGHLYQYKTDQSTTKHKWTGAEKMNFEGLTFDPVLNRLLLASKDPRIGAPNYRDFYSFDLSQQIYSETPIFSLEDNQLLDWLEAHPSTEAHFIKARIQDPEQRGFSPSGIAIHPATGHWYILSSVGKMLIELEPAGQIVAIIALDKKVHPQPEGITFLKDGTLLISDETKKGTPAQLHFFKQH